uniref:Uncharacterized protein n=1 Tax=Peronospora matthiolae TaxID=2874970 RepID=A0AAV1UFV7_9STRA
MRAYLIAKAHEQADLIPNNSTQSTLQRVQLPTPVLFDDYYTSSMWIVDEIQCLHALIVRSIRRLLNVLSATASEARLEVASLLHKYHCLLFQDAPTKAHKAMVGFSRWLADVLAGTNSEGAGGVPTHSEKAWLALKQQYLNNLGGQGAFAFDKATTVQLLKTACEYYMACCDRLQKVNSGLVSQLAELKTQLQRTLISAYESQHALEREREVSALQARHLVTALQTRDHLLLPRSRCEHPVRLHQQTVFDVAGTVSLAPQDVSEQASACESSFNISEHDKELEVATLDQEEEVMSPRLGVDRHVLPERQEALPGQQEWECATSPVAMYELSLNSTDWDYKQLTELRSSGEKHGRWYSYALRTLNNARKQKKHLKTQACGADGRPVNMFTASAVCKEANTNEFTQLVSTRVPAEDGEDKTWYRRTLQQLTNERQHRLSHRYRADSFCSTISIVD